MGDDASEVSVANAYCVVYKLDKGEWVVTGEGWAQVHYTTIIHIIPPTIDGPTNQPSPSLAIDQRTERFVVVDGLNEIDPSLS
jgi:hypothetical protein